MDARARLSCCGTKEADADEGAGELQQALQDLGAALVADTQPEEAEHPRQAALHHPAVAPEPLTRLDAPPGDPRRDTAPAQCATLLRVVVALVPVQLVGAEPWASWLATWPQHGRDGIHGALQVRRVVGVGGRERDRQRDAPAVHEQVVLAPELATVDRARSGLLAPLLARTLRLSMLA